MKRSMMELRIAEMLVDIRFDDPMEQAAYMLRRLEKAGMLPPLHQDIPKDDKDYIGWATEEFYNWEKEDEE